MIKKALFIRIGIAVVGMVMVGSAGIVSDENLAMILRVVGFILTFAGIISTVKWMWGHDRKEPTAKK